MYQMNPQKFTLAISGNGDLMTEFVEAVRRKYPGMTLYDRNEEAARPPSDTPIPSHPKVADIDAVFVKQGNVETATIRNRNGHRFFNYDPAPVESDRTSSRLLLNRMVQSVWDLLQAQPSPPPAEEFPSEPAPDEA